MDVEKNISIKEIIAAITHLLIYLIIINLLFVNYFIIKESKNIIKVSIAKPLKFHKSAILELLGIYHANSFHAQLAFTFHFQ